MMKKNKTSSVAWKWPSLFPALIIAVLCLGAVGAVAGDPTPAAEPKAAFKAADFNGNGKVSWEEFRNRVVAAFGHLDRNGDGRIAGDAHPPAVDKNGNPVQPGAVTIEAFTASTRAAFQAADKNNDGQLSLAEWLNK